MMELPLELDTRGGVLYLDTTADNSSTRLLLTAGGPLRGARLELDVADAQELAGALLQWLVENGHALPVLQPVPLEQYLDEDEDSDGLPAVQDAGTLLVRREGSDRVVIDRTDPWVVISGSLWDAVKHGRIPGATVAADVLTVQDSDGRRVQYRNRKDAGLGSRLCERISWRPAPLPDVSALPEHTR